MSNFCFKTSKLQLTLNSVLYETVFYTLFAVRSFDCLNTMDTKLTIYSHRWQNNNGHNFSWWDSWPVWRSNQNTTVKLWEKQPVVVVQNVTFSNEKHATVLLRELRTDKGRVANWLNSEVSFLKHWRHQRRRHASLLAELSIVYFDSWDSLNYTLLILPWFASGHRYYLDT